MRDAKIEAPQDALWFKGYASYRSKDRDRELILPKAFEKAAKPFLTGLPAVTAGHEFDAANAPNIGRIVTLDPREKGPYVEGYLGTNSKAADFRTNLKENVPMAFSIAFSRDKFREPSNEEKAEFGEDLQIVTEELELINVGIVNAGSNRNTPVLIRSYKGVPLKGAKEDLEEILAHLAAAGERIQQMMEAVGAQPPEGEPDPNARPEPDDQRAVLTEELVATITGATRRIQHDA